MEGRSRRPGSLPRVVCALSAAYGTNPAGLPVERVMKITLLVPKPITRSGGDGLAHKNVAGAALRRQDFR